MLNIKLVVVGKLKEKFHKDEVNEYLKRLERFAKVEIIEINDLPIPLNSSFPPGKTSKLLEVSVSPMPTIWSRVYT